MHPSPYGGGFDPSLPDLHFHAPRSHRWPPMRFDEHYRCYPMSMAPGPDRPDLNYGSKILLPPSALDKVSKLLVDWPLLMEVINGLRNKRSHCGVFEFVAEEGRAYLPQWMMDTLQLDVGDLIQLSTTSLSLAQMVKLQPQSVNFLDISDPRAVLERAFRNFAALTKGDVFKFEYNDEVFAVAVLDVKPVTAKMGVSMIETDVSVDFAPPVGYVEPEKASRGSGTSTPFSVNGVSNCGVHGPMATAINYGSIAPSSMASALTLSRFIGEGQRLNQKKVITTSTPTRTPNLPSATANSTLSAARGPMPLRLEPNMLFFGYDITHVKIQKQKDQENEHSHNPHFAGRGNTLRETARK